MTPCLPPAPSPARQWSSDRGFRSQSHSGHTSPSGRPCNAALRPQPRSSWVSERTSARLGPGEAPESLRPSFLPGALSASPETPESAPSHQHSDLTLSLTLDKLQGFHFQYCWVAGVQSDSGSGRCDFE